MDIIVGVSDMKVSNARNAVLSTYSLGSCIGIAIHDAVAKVGGLLHFMLPESSLNSEKAQTHPFMFADTGIPLFFREAYKMGAQKQRLKVIVVGGSRTLDPQGFFNIGQKNINTVQRLFRENDIKVDFQEVGGSFNRTLKLSINNGKILLQTSGKRKRVI